MEDFALDLDDFFISVDNPLVTVSEISGTPELAEVTFDSPQQGAHVFDFTYSYTNEEGMESSFTQTARLLNINEYANWSGAGVNFSDTRDRSINGASSVIEYELGVFGRYFNVELGNFHSDIGQNEITSGIVRVNQLDFRLENYDGVGVYNGVSLDPLSRGVSYVSIGTNHPWELNATGHEFLDTYTDYCNFGSGEYNQYQNSTVTITDEEIIGPYRVIEGSFSITITEGGYVDPSATCTLPATFTGDFRLAVDNE